MSVRLYSLLWTLNAILIVLIQPLLTYFDDWLTEHLHGRLYIGFSLFGLAFLLLIGATHRSEERRVGKEWSCRGWPDQ